MANTVIYQSYWGKSFQHSVASSLVPKSVAWIPPDFILEKMRRYEREDSSRRKLLNLIYAGLILSLFALVHALV